MSARLTVFILSVVLGFGSFGSHLYAQEKKADKKPTLSQEASQLVGVWEILATKEPGKPYRNGYKGRPFVEKGPHSFMLIMEYRDDGSFRRLSRIGENEAVHEGHWTLAGHELRHQRQGSNEQEVMYVRFDNPDQYTSTEVFEGTTDPGLFAQFKRMH
jgi:hypothetical protein